MPDIEITFELIKPTEEHARRLLLWRNDPVTLKNSFHTKPQEFEQFWTHFHLKYFSSGIPPVYIIHDNQRVGTIHFNDVAHPQKLRRKIVEISINIAPEARGKGIGAQALITLQNHLKGLGIDDLYAEIRQHNAISIRVFEKAGFSEIFRGNKLMHHTGEEVPIISFLLHLSDQNSWNQGPVFIIAEAGSNWRMGAKQRDLVMAKKLIDAAKEAGADAIKFQIYRSKDIYVSNAGKSNYLSEKGIHENISNIFDDLSMPYDMIPELQSYAAKHQIEFIATSFSKDDFQAVDPYVKMHKIASYELGHIRLLELAAASKKPLLLSTGAATLQEIDWAVSTYRRLGGKNLALMQCTAQYPANPEAMNLSAISHLKTAFGLPVGLSDHSLDPFAAPTGAVALGACVIEKHFTLSRQLPGPDHSFALEPSEFKAMVQAIRLQEKMVGRGVKMPLTEEEELRKFARRGIQAIQNIAKGELLQEGVNVAILRPGMQMLGIHSKHLSELEGLPSLNPIPLGRGIQFEDFKK